METLMNYKEYGKENEKVIVLLHGGGLSWWNYQEVAERLQDAYHVIIPILDGHAGSDRPFSSIEDNAQEIIEYIDAAFGGSVLMMGGLSLGGQILLEILSRKSAVCRYAIIESAMVIPSKLTHAMIGPAFGSSYGLIKHRWFSRLQFQSLHIKPDLFEDYYRDTCAIQKEDMIAFLLANTAYEMKDSLKGCKAQVHIFIGRKETKGIRDSAAAIEKMIPGSKMHVLPDMYHGEFSINYADGYAKIAEHILTGQSLV